MNPGLARVVHLMNPPRNQVTLELCSAYYSDRDMATAMLFCVSGSVSATVGFAQGSSEQTVVSIWFEWKHGRSMSQKEVRVYGVRCSPLGR
jgi:hypothetical protein